MKKKIYVCGTHTDPHTHASWKKPLCFIEKISFNQKLLEAVIAFLGMHAKRIIFFEDMTNNK